MSLPQADITALRSRLEHTGHAKVDSLFSEADLKEAETIIDRLMFSQSALVRYSRHCMGAQKTSGECRQIELIKPFLLSRKLRGCALFRTARAISSGLLNAKAHYQFDHAIYKGGGEPATIPWHQDQAYTGSKIAIPSIHLWIPFQDTDRHNGGMEFITGNPGTLLPHRPVTEGQKALTLVSLPDNPIEALQVTRGDVSIHNNFTIHRSGSNRSDQTRKAWILHFSSTSFWLKYWSKVASRFQ